MDLLGGYGSGSEAEDDEQQQEQVKAPSTAAGLFSSLPKAGGGVKASDLILGDDDDPVAPKAGLFKSLPAAGGAAGGSGLLSALPKPGTPTSAGGKRVVQLVRNIDPKLLYDSDDDESRPSKKAKTTVQTGGGGGSGFGSFLPAPQGQYGNKRSAQLDLGDDDAGGSGMVRRAGGAGASAPSSTQQQPQYMDSNEMYRVPDSEDPSTAPYAYVDPRAYSQPQPRQPTGPAIPADIAQIDPQLAEMLARQAKRQGAGPVFTEISAETVAYRAPGQREVSNALAIAYGEDYEAKIRAEAGPDPGKRAKSKHQISSLYHQAKLAEIELAEKKTQSMKTIKQTRGKYGW